MKKRLQVVSNLLLLLLLFGAISRQLTGTLVETSEKAALERLYPAMASARQEGTGFAIFDRENVRLGTAYLSWKMGIKAIGYGGEIPLGVGIAPTGLIEVIAVYPNSEDPFFLKTALDDGLLERWIGRSVAEAGTLQVDAVTGATMSSRAVIDGVEAICRSVAGNSTFQAAGGKWNFRLIAGALALIFAITVFFLGLNRLRTWVLVADVVLLGVVAGTFLSVNLFFSAFTGALLYGGNWLALGILVWTVGFSLVAGGKNFYCSYLCPLGAAQELVGKWGKKKTPLPHAGKIRMAIGLGLLFLWMLGLGLGLGRYELFGALVWGMAEWPFLVILALVLLASYRFSRPYCRMICPTGFFLTFLNQQEEDKE